MNDAGPREINLRSRSAYQRGRWLIQSNPAAHRRLTLLVHGFANSKRAAKASYAQMRNGLLLIDPATKLADDMYDVYWEGDATLFGISLGGLLSAPTYPVQMRDAEWAAARLAEYLRSLPPLSTGPRELNVVAHSMGAKVVLSALEALNGTHDGSWRIGKVMLMAGAVEERECAGRYSRTNIDSKQQSVECVLFSQSDFVLHRLFPVGQSFRLDQFNRVLFPRAIGYRGGPLPRWQGAGGHRVDMGGELDYGHSHYWGGAASARVLVALHDRTSVRNLPTRTIPTRWVENEVSFEERDLEPARTV